MANLKELLPMILGGLAGAASPRGAEAMNSVADTINRRKLQGEEMAMRKEDQTMQRESHGAQMKLRDLAMEDREKRETDAASEKVTISNTADYFIKNLGQEYGFDNPALEGLAELYHSPGMTLDTLKTLYKNTDAQLAKKAEESKQPTSEQTLKSLQDYAAQGLDAQATIGNATVKTRRPEETKPADRQPTTLEVKGQVYNGNEKGFDRVAKLREDAKVLRAEFDDLKSQGPDAIQGAGKEGSLTGVNPLATYRAKLELAEGEAAKAESRLADKIAADAYSAGDPAAAFEIFVNDFGMAPEQAIMKAWGPVQGPKVIEMYKQQTGGVPADPAAVAQPAAVEEAPERSVAERAVAANEKRANEMISSGYRQIPGPG